MIPADESPIMTLAEVAAYLRVHPSTVYRLAKRGKIPSFRIGSEWRFHRDQIDRLSSRPIRVDK